jgi:hypothetical protein
LIGDYQGEIVDFEQFETLGSASGGENLIRIAKKSLKEPQISGLVVDT